MQIFSEYIHPLTFWLQDHPHWAIFITFLISFAESLAIIGSIVPGSVTMTAIGILAGSGIMRIDLTFLAATLGAVAGDSGSYALGYIWSDRLTNIWPFKNYPNWVKYGKDYFARYGSASVLIGRFFGPMRSIIPVVAGMMRMKQWQFLCANVLSAIGWSILYVTPGVLIGAASSELSTKSASRLFMLMLVTLALIWLFSICAKWLVVHTHQFLRSNLHTLWHHLQHRHGFRKIWKLLTPPLETNYSPTAALTLSLIFCSIISILFVLLISEASWVATINNYVYLFFQSIRTQPFDIFFIAANLIISYIPLSTLMLAMFLYTLKYRDWITLSYWVSLILITGITLFLLNHLIVLPTFNGLTHTKASPAFPDINLTFATSLFVFFIFFTHTHCHTVFLRVLRMLLLIILLLAGISLIYLGDNWMTSVIASYLIGLTLCLFHWIFYRHSDRPHYSQRCCITFICVLLIVATGISYVLNFSKKMQEQNQPLTQYVMPDQVWWNQQQRLLPIYSTNRIGQYTGFLNLQYLGSKEKLQQALEESGWKLQSNSFFYSLLMRAGGQESNIELPVMTQFFHNRKPTLLMTYRPNNKEVILILRLWRSNYHLRHYHQPIWLGSVSQLFSQASIKNQTIPEYAPKPAYRYLMQALDGFKFNQVTLPHFYFQSLPQPDSSVVLLIREQ